MTITTSTASLNPFTCFACGTVDTTSHSCLDREIKHPPPKQQHHQSFTETPLVQYGRSVLDAGNSGKNNHNNNNNNSNMSMRMHSASFRNEKHLQSPMMRRSRSSERAQPAGDTDAAATAGAGTDAESYESYDDNSTTQRDEDEQGDEAAAAFAVVGMDFHDKSTSTTVTTSTNSSSRGTINGIDNNNNNNGKHATTGGDTVVFQGLEIANGKLLEEDDLQQYRHTGHNAGHRSRHDSDSRGHHSSTRKASFHRRSVSDPLDAQEFHSNRNQNHHNNKLGTTPEHSQRQHQQQQQQQTVTKKPPLPTLPRYPVAETRNKNCWSEPPVTIFHVRGDDYFSKKKKVPSGPYLLSSRGCDLFLSESGQVMNMTRQSQSILGGRLRSLPTLMINFRFPWGVMLLYFEIPAKLSPYMSKTAVKVDTQTLSVPEQVLAKWLMGNDEYKNERLKLIPYVAEGPWVVRNMVTGKPAIIGKRLPVTYNLDVGSSHHTQQQQQQHHSPLLECTLDIGSSSATAKRIVSVCRRYMSALTVDIGFVIQAETKDELPEQMMGSLRIHGADPLKAPTLL